MIDDFSHIDTKGEHIKMVNVGPKSVTYRLATARSTLRIGKTLFERLSSDTTIRENIFTVAKTASSLAAKKTPELIPLCHSLGLDTLDTSIVLADGGFVRIESTASTNSKTGVEMEALTAATVAALTVYDMCKSIDKTMSIEKTGLYKKKGGKSGNFENPEMEW